MTLVKSNVPLFPALPQFFDDVLSKDFFDWGLKNFSVTNTTIPAVNIVESPDQFTVEMAAPGMEKQDFHIELDNEVLKISSQKQHASQEMKEGDRYTRREFSYQSFQRSFHLPKSIVDLNKVQAKYENGILRILIPKREEAKALAPRTIDIK